jgi:UTP--glucose-1-phosphate uridylyltransferase
MTDVKPIRKCLFPVAGYGTRFLPATKAMPKEMLPIVNKPLIQYGVEEAVEAGVSEAGFITGRGKRAIADHFDTSYELEQEIRGTSKEKYLQDIRSLMDSCNFIFIRQRAMLGLGHAILTGEPIIGDEAFAVILADDLCAHPDSPDSKRALGQLVELYEKYHCSVIAIEEVPGDNISNYGVVSGHEIEPDVYEVDDMVEKPAPQDAPSHLGIIGRYVLTPDIFDYIRNTPPGANGEVQITDAIRAMAKEKRVLALKFKGQRFDCGSIEGFVDATNYYYQQYHQKK